MQSSIPKRLNPTKPEHFRPTSLCNTVYKLVTKILVHRLKPLLSKLISTEQEVFMPDHSISDNTLLAQEIAHALELAI